MKTSPKEPSFFDVRMTELRIRRGELTTKEWNHYLEQLPDVSEKGISYRPIDDDDSTHEMSEAESDSDMEETGAS